MSYSYDTIVEMSTYLRPFRIECAFMASGVYSRRDFAGFLALISH
ncbi:hypothetical protein [Mycobacterium simulans]|nr:hypothetical protein [Mycobacterium simulans]